MGWFNHQLEIVFFSPERLGFDLDQSGWIWKVGISPKKQVFLKQIEKVVGSQFTLREV